MGTLEEIRETIRSSPGSLCQTFEKSHMLLRHADMLVKDEIESSDNPQIKYTLNMLTCESNDATFATFAFDQPN